MQELTLNEIEAIGGSGGADIAVTVAIAWVMFGYQLGKDLATTSRIQCK